MAGEEEENHDSAPLLPIGEKRYLCVEYPGYVKSLKRALKTLGGEKALAQAIQNDSPVELAFRKNDIFSHPIKGDILPSTRLLVKVTRRVKRHVETGDIVEEEEEEGENEENWKTEIMGSVTKTLRFRAMADFQRIVSKDNPIAQLKQSLLEGNTDTLLDFNLLDHPDRYKEHLPPPLFSNTEVPFSYNYRQNAPIIRVRVKQPDGSYKIKLVNRSRRHTQDATHVYFFDEKIPSQSWHKLHEILDEAEEETKKKVKELFDQRPIWTTFAIKNMLPKRFEKHVQAVLPFFAYTFSDGPWRECWIKYGVDPRSDPKYAVYELIALNLRGYEKEPSKRKRTELLTTYGTKTKEDENKETDDAGSSIKNTYVGDDVPAKRHIVDGVTKPERSFYFQFCDVTDPDLTPIINNKNYLRDTPSKSYGFYYGCVFNRLREICKTKYGQLMKEGKADRVTNGEEGLKEAILKEKNKPEALDNNNNSTNNNNIINGDTSTRKELKAIERAARVATANMQKPNSSKRLKDVVDEYMNHLETHTGEFANDIVEQDDVQDEDFEEDFDEDFDIYEDGIDPFGDGFTKSNDGETNKDDPMEQ